MTTREVHTVHDHDEVHVEFVDGRVAVLRFRANGRTPREILGAIAAALDGARSQHRQDRAAVATPLPQPTPDADRDVVLAFAADQLRTAGPATPAAAGDLAPGRADGRDESGRAHLSISAEHVVILEVTPDLLADEREAGPAVREAFNLAAERLERDLTDWATARKDDEQLADVRWSELAFQVRQHRRGY